jgi:outer membrane protein W
MRNKIAAPLLVIVALLLVFGQVGFAQGMKGKFGIGARVAYVNFNGDDLGYGISANIDETAMYEGNLTYFVHNYCSFELGVDYANPDMDFKSSLGILENVGELEQIPILLTVRFHFSTAPKVGLYLGGGVGYYLNDFSSSSSVFPTDYDIDDSFGIHANAGFEYFLNENFALNFDLKYIWNSADVKIAGPSPFVQEDSVDLDTFYAGVGFKFYF